MANTMVITITEEVKYLRSIGYDVDYLDLDLSHFMLDQGYYRESYNAIDDLKYRNIFTRKIHILSNDVITSVFYKIIRKLGLSINKDGFFIKRFTNRKNDLLLLLEYGYYE